VLAGMVLLGSVRTTSGGPVCAAAKRENITNTAPNTAARSFCAREGKNKQIWPLTISPAFSPQSEVTHYSIKLPSPGNASFDKNAVRRNKGVSGPGRPFVTIWCLQVYHFARILDRPSFIADCLIRGHL
jgi:hypothetical protein